MRGLVDRRVTRRIAASALMACGLAAACTACGGSTSDPSRAPTAYGSSPSPPSQRPHASRHVEPLPPRRPSTTLVRDGLLIITDTRHDVYSYALNGRPVRADVPDADITTATVTNSRQDVVIRLRFAAPIGAKTGHNGGIRIRTNTGLERTVDYLFDQHINTLSLDRGDDLPTNCPVGLDKEYRKGVIGFTVPRRCLHDPQWIRVNIEHDRQGHGPHGGQFDYRDTPHNNRPYSRPLSPRVV